MARQGYVNLLSGRAPTVADTAEMVAARAEFLRAGHFDFVAEALAGAAVAGAGDAGLVVDVGAGTGFYLAEVLRRLPGHAGLGARRGQGGGPGRGESTPASRLRPCATCGGRCRWQTSAPTWSSTRSRRATAQEFHRILRPDGRLLVVTPGRRHLSELVATLGLIEVDAEKEARLDRALSRFFRLETVRSYERELLLSRTDAALLVAMGPSARHVEPAQVSARLAARPEPARVTASVELRVYRPVRSTDRPLPSHTAGPGTGPAAPRPTPGPTGAGRSRSSR